MSNKLVGASRNYRVDAENNYFSYDLIYKLIDEYQLNGSQAVVYLAIVDSLLTNPDQKAMTFEYLSSRTKLNKTSVHQIVTTLAEKELIKRWIPEGSNRRVSHYDFKVVI